MILLHYENKLVEFTDTTSKDCYAQVYDQAVRMIAQKSRKTPFRRQVPRNMRQPGKRLSHEESRPNPNSPQPISQCGHIDTQIYQAAFEE